MLLRGPDVGLELINNGQGANTLVNSLGTEVRNHRHNVEALQEFRQLKGA